jgi:hypothetical protein
LGIRDTIGFHPKVAIGISEDGTKLYFAASRLNQMVASEMAKSLKAAGAYRAILLDCGRTTQFRGYTDSEKSLWLNGYAPFFSERKIINSIVVYNDARTTQQSANVSSNGGSYLLSPSTEMSFDAGTFSDATTISYTPQFPKSTEGFDHIGRFFNIESTVNNTEVQPLKEYRITLAYDEGAVSPEVESQLALYHWNGSAWEKELSSVVNIEDNTITASPDHFSEWAILAPRTERLYLPLIRR